MRVAVLGSGLGSLALALRLRAAHVETVVFQPPGGWAAMPRVRERGWSIGTPEVALTARLELERLFATGASPLSRFVQMHRASPAYRLCWCDGQSAAGGPDVAEVLASWLRPADCRAVAARLFGPAPRERASPPLRFLSATRALSADGGPLRARFSAAGLKGRAAAAALFHAVLLGANARDGTSLEAVASLARGGWSLYEVDGGAAAIGQAMAGHFLEMGGELKVNARLERAEPHRAGYELTLRGLGSERFDVVVVNADRPRVFARLSRSAPELAGLTSLVEPDDAGPGLHLLVGARKRWPQLAYRTVLVDAELPRALGLSRGPLLVTRTVQPRTAASEGGSALCLSVPLPPAARSVRWSRRRAELAEALVSAVEPVLPGLRQATSIARLLTPDDEARGLDLRSVPMLEPTGPLDALWRRTR